MRFSIVIPTFNRIQTLQQTLEAVARQTHDDFEVIVVDDGSSDGTADLIPLRYPSIQFTRQASRGPAAARNCGIRDARGEIVAFTDDDCVPPPDWLARLADGYTRYPHVAGAGGYITAPDRVLRQSVLARYERSIGLNEYGAGDREVIGGFESPAGGTNNMSYRLAVLAQIGGFDETFPYAAGEDADLKRRVCQTGAQLLYLPMPVIHLQPYTWSHFRRQQINRGRGVVHFERKHAGRPPSRARIVLRSGKRLIVLIRDLMFKPHRGLSFVRFAAGWYDCAGQWAETKRLGR